ncbi:type I-MYXAN CRISPR-associated endonuclease Cas1 [Haliangium sp.]|uniref:type I-MYXAN CRISPR-associated endonuclease Cas1 n=1 Tax=Haliangium sp. TaxID=2663208 RepID=UPI003D1421C8
MSATDEPTIRVMALHALAYCERLFYLEEVEEIRVADAAVWAGRRMHQELDEPADVVTLTLEDPELGIRGRLDAVRRRDGSLYPVEHKRGRCRSGPDGPAPWDSDRLQALAYALLLERHSGRAVEEVRIRYHASNATVRVTVDDAGRADVAAAVARARVLAAETERPPVTADERRCIRCSLAPVCLPEETRLAAAVVDQVAADQKPTPVRLFPPDDERRSLHVVNQRARVGRSSDALSVKEPDAPAVKLGCREVSDVVLHGHAQITTQALRLCASHHIPVHWVTTSGVYLGAFAAHAPAVQRRIRQYRGLDDPDLATSLSRRLIVAKIQLQLQHALRASRKDRGLRARIDEHLAAIRVAVRGAAHALDREALLGHEGSAARAYFRALGHLVHPDAGPDLVPQGRSRRPPRDRFNALLSFGYGLLYRDVVSALLRVGLEPSFGLLHQPRSAAYPLALDLMELFRVPVVDMAVLGAVNRRTFDPTSHFAVTGPQVWLSDEGRRRLIAVYERRKHEEYRHPSVGYTLSYARMLELEARLLEKEWSGEPGLFARLRIR